MTLADFKELTGNAFAGPCYRSRDDEPVIVGKWCICGYNGDGTWDVWLCSPEEIAKGLSPQRLHAITQYVASLPVKSGPYRALTGEGTYTAMPTDTLIRCASRLGIKRRRKARAMTERQREALAAGRQRTDTAA
jgi:hypothetical protein